jgi:hypothetical protein
MEVILRSIKYMKTTNELSDRDPVLCKSVETVLYGILCQMIGREGATQSYGWYHVQ